MEVLLLTQESCAFCDEAKALLERLGDDYDLSLRVVDIGSEEGEALAQEGGILFAPGVFVDGEPVSYGRPSERRLRREFERVGG